MLPLSTLHRSRAETETTRSETDNTRAETETTRAETESIRAETGLCERMQVNGCLRD
jgi:hypothetical protein